MSFQLNQDLKFFNLTKFFFGWGGGGGGGTLATFYISFAGSLFIMIRQIQDQIISCLLRMNEFGNRQNSTFDNATSIID